MTLETGLSQPFAQVARWWRRSLPLAWRGLVAIGPGSDPDTTPRRAKVRLVLPEDRLLWREIDLPDLAADRRRAWVEARVQEHSPWAAGAYYWAEGAATDGKVQVALTAADPVQSLGDRLAATGRQLVEVTAGPLWLVEDDAAQVRLVQRLMLAWGLALALGLAAAGWSWLRMSDAQAAAALDGQRLTKLVASSTTTSATSQAARDLLLGKTEAASLATQLDRLAGSLPLDSHLQTLRLTPDGFEISGLSVAPEAIIPALQDKGGFTGVDFAGASALDTTSGTYSFALAGKNGVRP